MFTRHGDSILVVLTPREATLFGQVSALLDSVGTTSDDSGYRVLHRPFHLDDADAEHQLQSLVSAALDMQRQADRAVVERCALGTVEMSCSEAHGFLRSINEARLVLAARAGAFEEGVLWQERVGSDPALSAVAWLGYVQSELLLSLTGC